MNFKSLLSNFSEQNDIQLTDGDDGSVEATFDDKSTRLKFAQHSRDEARLEAEVVSVDPESDEGKRTLSALLKGNLALLKNQTGSLTVSADRRSVFLFERVPIADTNPGEFTDVVESFLDRIDTFRRGLAAAI